MHRSSILPTFKRVSLGVVALAVLFFSPAPYVFADDGSGSSSSDTSSCNPSVPAPTGIRKPTGSDAVTYTYNECTGLWENPHYTWDPATQQATPKSSPAYTCDTTTWTWTTSLWVYNPAGKVFNLTPFSSSTLPVGALVAAGSLNPCTPAAASSAADPASTNASSTDNGTDTSITDTTNASIHNTLGSNAATGNTQVIGNTLGGSATSGNAAAVANVLNALQSSSALAGQGLVTFVANVNGDVQGDLVIDPSTLQPATSDVPIAAGNLTVNNQATGAIANNITVGAQSGNATVADNTTGGNATSGNAAAIADVVNMINSVISAGKSFLGVININGNLNGNILMPQSFLDSLLASNAPTATLSLTPDQAQSLGIDNTANLNTTNNVTSSAQSGTASVSGNSAAGSATSGNAKTDVTIFNLTGNQVIAANSLLVFVNVSGKWVGVIMNAPQGTTAAAFGSGVSANGMAGNADITNNTNDTITNNIGVNAQSGNATVADNTTGGNATSGNANTAVNLLNMNDASFNLSGWFGILFINVFGNWYGNFGVYTPPAVPSSTSQPSESSLSAPTPAPTFQFIPKAPAASSDGSVGATLASQLVKAGSVLGTSVVKPAQSATANTKSVSAFQVIDFILIGGGAAVFVIERIVSRRSAARSAL